MKKYYLFTKCMMLLMVFVLSACENGGNSTDNATAKVAHSKLISKFSINNSDAVIEKDKISIILPYGSNLSNLKVNFTTTGKKVDLNGIPQKNTATLNLKDKTKNQKVTSSKSSSNETYTVTARDGTQRKYQLNINLANKNAKSIIQMSINNVPAIIQGEIVSIILPAGTNLTNLTPVFTTTGQSVSVNGVTQVSGQSQQNFTKPVRYTVKAADGTISNYILLVRLSPSSSKSITTFTLDNVNGIVQGDFVSVVLPYGTDVTDFVPIFTTTGQSVSVNGVTQVSGQSQQNFTKPVTYTVIAADGTTKNYTITVHVALNPAKNITSLIINNVNGLLQGDFISIILPAGTNLTNLTPVFTTTGQSVSVNGVIQVSGQTQQNFTNPVTYTVTAADGSVQNYTVIVQDVPSASKSIITFAIDGYNAVIQNNIISVVLPYGNVLTDLLPTFTTSGYNVSVNGIQQVSGQTTQNFTNRVTYTVTADDGTTKNYTVSVKVAPSSFKAIVELGINNVNARIQGNKISLILPYGTNLTNLTPVFTTTGQSVSVNGVTQVSGQTSQNFTNPVTYTVTAADGTTKNYTVIVNVLPNPKVKLFTSFGIQQYPGIIQGNNIFITLPFGTDLTSLTPYFTSTSKMDNVFVDSGFERQVSGQTPQNFTNPVIYNLASSDGTVINKYTVTVKDAPSPAKAITSFTLDGVNGVISGNNITVTVLDGANIFDLISTFTTTGQGVYGSANAYSGTQIISGQTVLPIEGGQSTLFVQAADGSIRAYTVKIKFREFAYVATDSGINVYSIQQGKLVLSQQLSTSSMTPPTCYSDDGATYTVPIQINRIDTDPLGAFLYYENIYEANTHFFNIGSNGLLSASNVGTASTQDSCFRNGGNNQNMYFFNGNAYLTNYISNGNDYIVSSAQNNIYTFPYSQAPLTLNNPVILPKITDMQFQYNTNYENNPSVFILNGSNLNTYNLNPSNYNLTSNISSSVATDGDAIALKITPSGCSNAVPSLMSVNRDNNSIGLYGIDLGYNNPSHLGNLNLLENIAIRIPTIPHARLGVVSGVSMSCAVGGNLYFYSVIDADLDNSKGEVVWHQLQNGNTVTQLGFTSLNFNPNGITTDITGQYVYVYSSHSGQYEAFSINPDGSLATIQNGNIGTNSNIGRGGHFISFAAPGVSPD